MTTSDATEGKHVNDGRPNFYDETGRFYLKRCFACDRKHGTENWAMAVYDGRCAWCGWKHEPSESER